MCFEIAIQADPPVPVHWQGQRGWREWNHRYLPLERRNTPGEPLITGENFTSDVWNTSLCVPDEPVDVDKRSYMGGSVAWHAHYGLYANMYDLKNTSGRYGFDLAYGAVGIVRLYDEGHLSTDGRIAVANTVFIETLFVGAENDWLTEKRLREGYPLTTCIRLGRTQRVLLHPHLFPYYTICNR